MTIWHHDDSVEYITIFVDITKANSVSTMYI